MLTRVSRKLTEGRRSRNWDFQYENTSQRISMNSELWLKMYCIEVIPIFGLDNDISFHSTREILNTIVCTLYVE